MNLKRPDAPHKTTIFSLFLLLSACATAQPVTKAKYEVYGLDLTSNIAFAKNPKDDVGLPELCGSKGKCILMTIGTYERMRADFIRYRNQLIQCQNAK